MIYLFTFEMCQSMCCLIVIFSPNLSVKNSPLQKACVFIYCTVGALMVCKYLLYEQGNQFKSMYIVERER